MRFGLDLHHRRVPAWSDFYIDYAHLKTQIRSHSPLESLKEAINGELDIVDNFISTQSRNIDVQIAALNEHWGIDVGTTDAVEYLGVFALELEDLKESLVECSQDIQLFHRYVQTNRDALRRILGKAGVLYGDQAFLDIAARATRFPRHDEWLVSLNRTLRLVREAMRHDADVPRRSLLLDRHGNHHPSADLGEKNHALSPERPPLKYRSLSFQSLLLRTLRTSHLSYHPHAPIPKHHDYLHGIVQYLARSEHRHHHLDGGVSAANAFHQTLKAIRPCQLTLLQNQDPLDRTPLHHAARLGLDGICREILSATREDTKHDFPGQCHLCCEDVFDQTPISCAVEHGHAAVVEILLDEYKSHGFSDGRDSIEQSDLLALAISSQYVDVAMQLMREGWGARFTTRDGKNVLHLAAEQGLSDLVKDLLFLGLDVNTPERARGWTPLTIACVQGHEEMVATLLRVGADASVRDTRGWLAKDHAAYRGHTRIVNSIALPGSPSLSSESSKAHPIVPRILPPFSSTDSTVFVHLGTLDLFKAVTQIDIKPYRKRISPLQMPDSSLTLSISLAGDKSQEQTTRLPFTSDNSDAPWCFTTNDPDQAVLVFKLTSSLQVKPIGTAVALLASLAGGIGHGRESLIRDFKIPFINDKYGHVGSMVFTFLVARPYQGAISPPKNRQTLEFEPSTIIGGHRGLGWNDGQQRLQLGENTLQSFQSALDLGADLVECDVQLTKDDVPFVYHDWLVSEKGCDAPMYTLTHKQLMAISEAQCVLDPRHAIQNRLPWDDRDRPRNLPLSRRRSFCAPLESGMEALISQMAHTLNYPGWKPNLRSHSIHGPFLSMEEMFYSLPEEVPIHVEIKYPMLSEASDFQMDRFAPEINHFTDSILSVIYAHAHARPLILTSFSPEVCMLLAVKQQSYPVLFLNDSNNSPTGDRRATSVQAAKRFAHRFSLEGVGMAGEPFVASPGLVGILREQGLYTASYGSVNDEVQNAEAQAEAGLDLIIVNKVKLVKQTLDNYKKQGV